MTREARLASALVARCGATAGECVTVLVDSGTVESVADAVEHAAAAAGATPVRRSAGERVRAFADLPSGLLDELLTPGLVIDLTSVPWLYSDSFTRYAGECRAAGSRLALVWADDNDLASLLACLPDESLFAQASQFTNQTRSARTLNIHSKLGTDFTVELAGEASFIGEAPTSAGTIGAPLYASVTMPFAPGTANGGLVFTGSGRLQGPIITPFSTAELVTITVASGQVTAIVGDGQVANLLRDWRAAAPTSAVDRIMDCNIGFDPRGNLAAADNMVVHSYADGIMIGIGSPYEHHPEGSFKPDFHLDLLFTGTDVSIDSTLVIKRGRFAN